MKAILISIKPKYVAKILNGEKTIEIRKTCPQVFKDLKPYEGCSIDVYIYCTKGDVLEYFYDINDNFGEYITHKGNCWEDEQLNGKVVAKFTLNKVEEIRFDDKEVQRKVCLTEDELFDYLFVNEPYHEDMKKGYAWHISNLVIFDKPKELSEFKMYKKFVSYDYTYTKKYIDWELRPLNKAPQSWCRVEV